MTAPDGRHNLLQLRRDTTADWAAADPVLAAGEPGWDSTAGILKIGDGVTPWSGLEPFSGGPLEPAWTAGRYYRTPNAGLSTSNTTGNGTLRVARFPVFRDTAIDRLGAEIAVAGSAGCTYRLGIYADDGTGRPGALVVDAGTIAGDSATVQQIVVAADLPQGFYFVGGVVQGAPAVQPTVRVLAASGGLLPIADYGAAPPGAGAVAIAYSLAGVAGALPDPFGAPASAGNAPACFVRAA